jgi:integrase
MTTYRNDTSGTPMRGSAASSGHSILSPLEASKLLHHFQGSDPRIRIVLALMLLCALRRKDLLALRLEDFGDDFISVWTTRGGMRDVPYPEMLRDDINTLLAIQQKGLLLQDRSHLDSCLRRIRTAALAVGITKSITCSGLRGACLKFLIQSGASMNTLIHISGRRSVFRYIHVSHELQAGSLDFIQAFIDRNGEASEHP